MRKPRTPRWLVRVVIIQAVLASMFFAGSGVAQASTSCGTSSGHSICVTVPDGPLTGASAITVTNNPNSGVVIATWIPSGRSAITLIQEFGPSPGTNNYSFTWPTQKYLDASGVLRVQANATNTTPVEVPVTLQNGNVTDFQHSLSDWESFLPNPSWTEATDPLVVAVGDGASDQPAGNALAQSIALSDPELLLYLGDIYETGTFTENLNHFGQNSMDGGPGTLWGAMGTITQPAMGDHEAANSVAWRDYFHGRPLYTSFEFANVLFFDLASAGVPFGKTSAQYNYVKSVLTSTTNPPPPCIITYFQNPVIAKSKVVSNRVPMWSLLTNNGGDLLFNGDNHTMIQYKPLNDQVQLPSPGQPTMVEMISGAGGHSAGATFTGDARVDWSQGQTPGAVHLTLDGAAAGGVPTGLSWAYEDTNGNVLNSGSRNCGAGPATPTITSFSPSNGEVGTSVTINGSGFNGTTDVRFNGTSVGSGNFTVVSGGKITATVPSGATTGPISVTAPGGTATSSTDFTVTVPPAPVITDFSPVFGPPGTSVTINGSGFGGTTDVQFNGTTVGSGNFTVGADTQITATVPSGATTGPISVTAPGGTATSSTDFTVTPSPVPVITDFTPTSGPIGTSVTISGSGFFGTTDVQFNGTSVGSGNFAVDADTQITATVPSGASTGPISVTTPGGTGASLTDFTVTRITTLSFGPDADTFVRSDSPTAHPGSKISFTVDGSPVKHGLLKFTVSGVGSDAIESVMLRLYCLDASDHGGDFFRVADNSWQENAVTWNTQPAADPTSIASLGAVSANTWYEVDLSSLVTGDGTYSIQIASASANGADYSSREGTAGFAPQVVVTLR